VAPAGRERDRPGLSNIGPWSCYEARGASQSDTMFERAGRLGFPLSLPGAAGRASDVVAVRFDQLTDVLATLTGTGASVFDGAAQANVVPDDVRALRVGANVLHVALPHPEVPGSISAVVRSPAFRHALPPHSRCPRRSRIAARESLAGSKSQTPRDRPRHWATVPRRLRRSSPSPDSGVTP